MKTPRRFFWGFAGVAYVSFFMRQLSRVINILKMPYVSIYFPNLKDRRALNEAQIISLIRHIFQMLRNLFFHFAGIPRRKFTSRQRSEK